MTPPELAYDEEGSGPPLVLVHGSWTDRSSWEAVRSRFAHEGFRVIRYDRRGHGESPHVPGTLEDDADDLGRLIDRLEARPAHVVASSRGGTVALKLAARDPGAFRSLVAHEPPATGIVPPEHPARPAIDRVVAGERAVCDMIAAGEAEEAARRFVDAVAFGEGAWARLPQRVREGFVRHADTFLEEVRDPDAGTVDLAGLARLDVPVLLTRGDRSPAWYGAIVTLLARTLPAAQQHVFRGAGHTPQAGFVGPYVRTIAAFLQAVDAD